MKKSQSRTKSKRQRFRIHKMLLKVLVPDANKKISVHLRTGHSRGFPFWREKESLRMSFSAIIRSNI